jgi:hypothetical protein
VLLAVAVTSVIVLILANDLAEFITYSDPEPAARLLLRLPAILALITSLLGLFRLYLALAAYFDWRGRVLRDMLIGHADPRELTHAAAIIDDAAENSRGPRRARARAIEELRERGP